MSADPGDHPPPHPELATQRPLIFTLHAGDLVYRHHRRVHSPIYFGKTADYRFDDPARSYGVLYVGQEPACCLLETCETTGVPAVSGAFLDERAIARLELTEDLRFVDLATEGGLISIGADVRLTAGSYLVAQQWSAALKRHPCNCDGIRYRSRHDPGLAAYAVYERPPTTFKVTSMGSFTDPGNIALFQDVLRRFPIDLV